MVRNERGFTLVEALISLVIVAVFTLISYPFVINLYDYFQLNRLLTTFQADLHRVRDVNMMPFQGEEQMTLRIYHQENRYVILVGSQMEASRDFPRNVTMPHQNAVSHITFNSQGNLGMGRTIVVRSREHERRVVFSVGLGGFDVRE